MSGGWPTSPMCGRWPDSARSPSSPTSTAGASWTGESRRRRRPRWLCPRLSRHCSPGAAPATSSPPPGCCTTPTPAPNTHPLPSPEALAEAGITGSIGTVGDALDNALMESTIGPFKTEVIEHEQPVWSSWREAEKAVASWVQWYNHERLHSSIGGLPPAEYEQQHYASTQGRKYPAAA